MGTCVVMSATAVKAPIFQSNIVVCARLNCGAVRIQIANSVAAPAPIALRLSIGAADRKSTRLNSSHGYISYAVFCLKKKRRRGQKRGGRCRQKPENQRRYPPGIKSQEEKPRLAQA